MGGQRRGMNHVSGIIESVLDAAHLKQGVANYGVVSRWEALVGNDLAGKTQPLRVDNGTLIVAVDNPVLHHQLTFLVPALLERIHREVPASRILSIRFVPKAE
jgi:hypothetical protein